MLKQLGIFPIFAICLFAMVISGDFGGAQERGEAPPPEGMVLIPAGTFQMGGEDDEARNDEQPVHTVHLDAFYMDKHQVTNAQFKAFVDANPQWGKDQVEERFHDDRRTYLWRWDGNDYPDDVEANDPVGTVSWYAAMAYAKWAGKRLPTEAEWEYAARGGLAGKKYPWGDILVRKAGDEPPNGYGLSDIMGKGQVWCLDEYDADFYAASDGSRNPIAGGQTIEWLCENFKDVPEDSVRVRRGGASGDSATYLRVARRNRNSPTLANGDIGFRCVKDVTP